MIHCFVYTSYILIFSLLTHCIPCWLNCVSCSYSAMHFHYNSNCTTCVFVCSMQFLSHKAILSPSGFRYVGRAAVSPNIPFIQRLLQMKTSHNPMSINAKRTQCLNRRHIQYPISKNLPRYCSLHRALTVPSGIRLLFLARISPLFLSLSPADAAILNKFYRPNFPTFL